MRVFTEILPYIGNPALILAIGSEWRRAYRTRLLSRAIDTGLETGTEDQRREAALQIVDELTSSDEPWYRRILPGRKTGAS